MRPISQQLQAYFMQTINQRTQTRIMLQQQCTSRSCALNSTCARRTHCASYAFEDNYGLLQA